MTPEELQAEFDLIVRGITDPVVGIPGANVTWTWDGVWREVQADVILVDGADINDLEVEAALVLADGRIDQWIIAAHAYGEIAGILIEEVISNCVLHILV